MTGFIQFWFFAKLVYLDKNGFENGIQDELIHLIKGSKMRDGSFFLGTEDRAGATNYFESTFGRMAIKGTGFESMKFGKPSSSAAQLAIYSSSQGRILLVSVTRGCLSELPASIDFSGLFNPGY
jgi:hypothetical protein